MKNNEEIKGYAILYKKILVSSGLIFFLPCACINGDLTEDGIFYDKEDVEYFPCNSYDFINSIDTDLYYYNFISKKDLKKQYHDLNPQSERVYEYKYEMFKNILLGSTNYSAGEIDIITITYDMIIALKDKINYNMIGNYGQVSLNTVLLEQLLNENSITKIKDQLKDYLNGIKMVEKLNQKEGVIRISTTPNKSLVDNANIGTDNFELEKELKGNIEKDNNLAVKKQTYNELYKYVKARMFGQDDAIENILTIILSSQNNSSRYNLARGLVVGPTGTGKTLIFRLIGEYLDIPVIEYDCNSLTQEGYVGNSVNDLLKTIYHNSGNKIDRAQRSILILDEFDKLAARGSHVTDEGVQKALLKLLDGGTFEITTSKITDEKINFDTSQLIVFAAGAFDGIRKKDKTINGFTNSVEESDYTADFVNKKLSLDEFVKYGMIRELIARFSYIIPFSKMTKEEYKHILVNSLISPFKIKQDIFWQKYQIKLEGTDGYFNNIVKRAYGSGYNSRGINIVVNESLLQIEKYILCTNEDYTKIIATEETANDPKKYIKKRD